MRVIISKDGKGVKYALANLSIFFHKALHGFTGCDMLTLSTDCIDDCGNVKRQITLQLTVDDWESLDTQVFAAQRQEWIGEILHQAKG